LRSEVLKTKSASLRKEMFVLRSALRNFHWMATLGLALALVPLSRVARLPLRYDLGNFFRVCIALALQSALLAAILWAISGPREFLKKMSVSGRAIPFPKEIVIAMLAPAAYFVVGFLLVISYNDLIASLRFDGQADAVLARIDSWLLAGNSVTSWAHWTVTRLPGSFKWIQLVYFVTFSLMGACMVILGVSAGLRRSMQFVGALLSAYYIALFLFFFVPATGPYLTDHSSLWPKDSLVYILQQTYSAELPRFRLGYRPVRIGADYFMAFPCMHLVQPLIVLWFLRQRRALAWIVAGYTIVLVPCIVLLEEHYVIDLIASVPVAAFAIVLVEGLPTRRRADLPAKS
jgi:hypothetical protein